MRQNGIDSQAQIRRKKDALGGALSASVSLMVSAAVLLIIRFIYAPDGFWGSLLLILTLANMGMLIPVWILLKIRFIEIEGGEENAASKY